MRLLSTIVFVTMIAVAVSAQPLEHVLVYVDNAVAGPGSGTYSDPFSTIAGAVAYVWSHDYIIVRPGIYYEAVNLPYFVFLRSEQGPGVTTIDATGQPGTHAVTIGTLGEVVGFTIIKQDGAGLYTSATTSEFGRVIKGNRIMDCPNGGVELDGAMHPAFAENLVVDCGPFGVRLSNGASPFFTGGTVTGCAIGVDRIPGPAPDPISFIANSIFWGNTTDVAGITPPDLISCNVGDPAFAGVNGSISADPLWKNAPARDFRLPANSPCVEAGDVYYNLNSSEFDNRGYGNWRKMDGDHDGVVIPDIGAFERGGLETTQVGAGAGSVVVVEIDTGPNTQWFLAYGSYALGPAIVLPTAGGTSPFLWIEQSTSTLMGSSTMNAAGHIALTVNVPAWAVGQHVDVQALGVDYSSGTPVFNFTNAERVVVQ